MTSYSGNWHKPVLFTCEHGGNRIPTRYLPLFRGKNAVLESHRGRDAGALELAKHLASELTAPLVYSETSRLLVDLNRSLHHHHLFSEFTRQCDSDIRRQIIEHHYLPYRKYTESTIKDLLESGRPVLHFSIHSFTPRLDNYQRKTDIGLLYDPRHQGERALCINLQMKMRELAPQRTVRRNYPYRGNTDGFTTHLRKLHDEQSYCGIEIEVNQKYVHREKEWQSLSETITNAIKYLIADIDDTHS